MNSHAATCRRVALRRDRHVRGADAAGRAADALRQRYEVFLGGAGLVSAREKIDR
jgi:hypothetical protein